MSLLSFFASPLTLSVYFIVSHPVPDDSLPSHAFLHLLICFRTLFHLFLILFSLFLFFFSLSFFSHLLLSSSSLTLLFSSPLLSSSSSFLSSYSPYPSLSQAELSGMRACHLRDGAAESEFLAWLEDELANPKGNNDKTYHSYLPLQLHNLFLYPKGFYCRK